MENKPLVSVAMATYNGEKFIREQLDSILCQTYPNIEIVVTDDCSTDATPAILDEYAAQHENVRVYHNEKNLGLTANFEKAASLSRGELIAFADQDDIWMPEKIEILTNNLGDNTLVYSDSAYIDREGNPLGKGISTYRHLINGRNLFTLDDDSGIWIPGHAAMFRRELLDKAIPFNPLFNHDISITIHAMIAGTVKAVPDKLVLYRQHGGNVVGGLGCHAPSKGPEPTKEEILLKSIARREALLAELPENEDKFRNYLSRMIRYEHNPVFINRFRRMMLRMRYLGRLYTPRKRNLLRKAHRVIRDF